MGGPPQSSEIPDAPKGNAVAQTSELVSIIHPMHPLRINPSYDVNQVGVLHTQVDRPPSDSLSQLRLTVCALEAGMHHKDLSL